MVKLVVRRANLASRKKKIELALSGQISSASSKFVVKKAIFWKLASSGRISGASVEFGVDWSN